MKNKIKKILGSNRGETLVESLAAILLMSILLIAVGTIINVSLNFSRLAVDNARVSQGEVDEIILGNYDEPEPATIEFYIQGSPTPLAWHEVTVNDGDITAFTPAP